MQELLLETLRHALMITGFVMLMMVVVEYINVQNKNRWAEKLRHSPLMQILMAALLGIVPGCMGSFAVVSLYTHRMIRLAAVVAAMIATSGDEAFVMFALFPGKALLINGILFVVAILAGGIIHLLSKKKKEVFGPQYSFVIHQKNYCKCFEKRIILPQLKRITFERSLLLFATTVFSLLLVLGVIGHEGWGWEKITLLAGSLFLLFVFLTVPEHFLKEHLYNHIIKKHFLRIMLWSWGAFILLHFVQTEQLLGALVENNPYWILLAAVLIGIIPESGPHLVFVTLFSQQLIPFSILLASSIVQDGHGMLPMLAESRKDFFLIKGINILIGLVIGMLLLFLGL